MKKYFIIKEDGSSLFALPYPEDFVYHCLIKLLDRTDEQFKLLSFQDPSALQQASPLSLSACDGSEVMLQLYLGAPGHPRALF